MPGVLHIKHLKNKHISYGEGLIKLDNRFIFICSTSMATPLIQVRFAFPKEDHLESYLCQIKGIKLEIQKLHPCLRIRQAFVPGFKKQVPK